MTLRLYRTVYAYMKTQFTPATRATDHKHINHGTISVVRVPYPSTPSASTKTMRTMAERLRPTTYLCTRFIIAALYPTYPRRIWGLGATEDFAA